MAVGQLPCEVAQYSLCCPSRARVFVAGSEVEPGAPLEAAACLEVRSSVAWRQKKSDLRERRRKYDASAVARSSIVRGGIRTVKLGGAC